MNEKKVNEKKLKYECKRSKQRKNFVQNRIQNKKKKEKECIPY
jgi:hypothetical protein